MFLEVEDLHVFYNKFKALNGISLKVGLGEIVTLIGANGAGKTTTLLAISGIISSKTGIIKFDNERIDDKNATFIARKGITHIPEGRRIFPYLSVEENLIIGAHLRTERKEISEDLEQSYQLFPVLKDRRRQMGGSLSGGEQQMLAIARALMSKPKLLLLDEPSMGLAPIIVQQVYDIIGEINKKKGITILLVEQNAFKALNIANRGYVIEVGNIILNDNTKNLLKNEEVIHAYLGS